GMAPHGVYRCAGVDEWLALAVRDDAEWLALCSVAASGWEDGADFSTLPGRLAHREALDAAIETWTSAQPKEELLLQLQAAGVASGAVQSAPEWHGDAHLQERGYFFSTTEIDTGTRRYDGSPFRFAGRRGYEAWRRSPGLGEHNREVLEGVAGLSSREVDHLEAAGTIVNRPPQ